MHRFTQQAVRSAELKGQEAQQQAALALRQGWGSVVRGGQETITDNASKITLVPADRVAVREAQGLGNVNGNMATAHAELGVIQQASNAGVTKGADMTITVKGEKVCDFCRGDIPAAANAAGLKSLEVVDQASGVIYYWLPGMTRLKPR